MGTQLDETDKRRGEDLKRIVESKIKGNEDWLRSKVNMVAQRLMERNLSNILVFL